MTRTELEKRLLGARDGEAAVAALADFFTAHELTFGHGTDNASAATAASQSRAPSSRSSSSVLVMRAHLTRRRRAAGPNDVVR